MQEVYKTKWCEFVSRAHGCRWGDQCRHAHHSWELRPIPPGYRDPGKRHWEGMVDQDGWQDWWTVKGPGRKYCTARPSGRRHLPHCAPPPGLASDDRTAAARASAYQIDRVLDLIQTQGEDRLINTTAPRPRTIGEAVQLCMAMKWWVLSEELLKPPAPAVMKWYLLSSRIMDKSDVTMWYHMYNLYIAPDVARIGRMSDRHRRAVNAAYMWLRLVPHPLMSADVTSVDVAPTATQGTATCRWLHPLWLSGSVHPERLCIADYWPQHQQQQQQPQQELLPGGGEQNRIMAESFALEAAIADATKYFLGGRDREQQHEYAEGDIFESLDGELPECMPGFEWVPASINGEHQLVRVRPGGRTGIADPPAPLGENNPPDAADIANLASASPDPEDSPVDMGPGVDEPDPEDSPVDEVVERLHLLAGSVTAMQWPMLRRRVNAASLQGLHLLALRDGDDFDLERPWAHIP